MTKKRQLFSVLIFLLTITACNPVISSDQRIVDKFRATIKDDGASTYGDFFTQLAGLRGDVKYKVFIAEGETNPDVKVIEVNIDKKDESVEYKRAKIQYQFNEKTGFIRLGYLEVNGEPQNLLVGSMSLGMMLMESSLK